jgi:hypothetical protein
MKLSGGSEWTRGDLIALIGLGVAVVSCVLAIPAVQVRLGFSEPPKADTDHALLMDEVHFLEESKNNLKGREEFVKHWEGLQDAQPYVVTFKDEIEEIKHSVPSAVQSATTTTEPTASLDDLLNQAFALINVKKYGEAFPFFLKAANQGSANAQTALGWMYENGLGTPRDLVTAFSWYQKAGVQGYPSAETDLGHMYQNGTGVVQSPTDALKWFRKAAEHGDPDGEYNLGVAYERGDEVTQDLSIARDWYAKAAAKGDPNAKQAINRLESK